MYMMFRWYDPRWSDMTILCNVVWCYGTCLQASLLFLFCLKALFSFLFLYGHNAKCINQDSNFVYAGTILWHKGWYDTNMIWYVCNGRCRSLMCTSNVAENTQMASLDRQVTQNGLGVINAMEGNIQWRDTIIPRWYGGYRPCRWWVAVILMEIPRWWKLVPK